MTDSLLSWYWNLNLLLAVGFVLWTVLQGLSRWPRFQLSGKARLLWARRLFTGALVAALLVSLEPQWLALAPWAQTLKAGIIDEWTAVAGLQQTNATGTGSDGYPWLLPVLTAGWLWQLARLATELYRLKRAVARTTVWKKTPKAHLLVSAAIAIPFATRALGKYLIVLPARLLTTPPHWRFAAQHEFQHARNGDLDWLLLLEALHMLCFWNPFLHAWQREFEALHELACDETLVVERRVDAQAYGNCLLELAQYQSSPLLLGASSMVPLLRWFRNHNTLLRRRIMKLGNIRKEKYSHAKSTLFGALIAGGLLGGSLLIAADAPTASQDVPTEVPLLRINPDYPAEALAQGAEGWVRLRFSIDAEGAVYDAKVMESCAGPAGERCILNVPLFAESALKAIQGWRYSAPTTGQPHTGVETILRYQLEEETTE